MQLKKSLKELYYSKNENNENLEKAGLKDKIKTGIVAGSSLLFNPSIQNQTQPIELPKQETVSPLKEEASFSENTKQEPEKFLKPGEILHDYRDPRHLATEEFYENKFGLPKKIITSIRVAGEMSHWGEASNLGTKTVYQFTPHTRKLYIKKYGVDPWKDTESSIHATALHLKESMNWANKKFKPKNEHQQTILAAKHFHGGPKTFLWGKVNENYGKRIDKGRKMLLADSSLEHLDHIFKQPNQMITQKSIQYYVDEVLAKSLHEVETESIQIIVDEALQKSLEEVIKKI